jgi:phospholipase C
MLSSNVTRRELLKIGAATAAAEVAGVLLPGCGGAGASTVSPSSVCATLAGIEHVVIFIQENRSFDHYFGSYRGVRGFSDPSPAFRQPDPANTTNPPTGVLLPFHLDTTKTNAACTHDITHDWVPQHQSWDHGAMDGFVTSRVLTNTTNDAVLTMGYYTRADLPFYYAVADAFTLCDNYFCSVIGPTDPNRLYTMAASVDPAGKNGGPLLQTLIANRLSFYGKLTYTTMPEQLQARGISWKVYSSPDQNILLPLSNNVLAYFKNFQDPTSPLYRKAFLPQFPVEFLADALSGNLPQVSWVLASIVDSEHPPAPSLFGENALSVIISALTGNPALWAKTVLFATYDENGGFFDHVPPVTAPPGTPDEYITAPAVPDPTAVGNPPILGPIGLGFRVPMLVISPFSRGGLVSSALFDHTSVLRFLETRFGAEVPNLSAWRRATVGDLTSALNFRKPDQSVPALPSTLPALPETLLECVISLAGTVPYQVPNPQSSPTQETGTAAAPSGPC